MPVDAWRGVSATKIDKRNKLFFFFFFGQALFGFVTRTIGRKGSMSPVE